MALHARRLGQYLTHFSRVIVRIAKSSVRTAAFQLRLNRLLARVIPRPMVLGYHRVIARSESLLVRRIGAVTAMELASQLAYLRSLGYRVVPLEQAADPAAGRVMAVTFDDGFRDLFDVAYPLFAERGEPFTLFLVTALPGSATLLWQHKLYALLDRLPPGRRLPALSDAMRESGMGDRVDAEAPGTLDQLLSRLIRHAPPEHLLATIARLDSESPLTPDEETALASSLYLTAEELREMSRHGLGIQAHGDQHLNLTILSSNARILEVSRSLDRIESEWGARPTAYSVAHGMCNANVRHTLAAEDLAIVVAGRSGLVADGARDDLPRVWPNGTGADFAWMITRLLWRHRRRGGARDAAGRGAGVRTA